MSLRKIFTRVKENILENLCTEEVEKKIERSAVKVGNALIFGSQLPAAKKFKRWVIHEVLPSIRKYGFYGLLDGEQVKQLTDKQYLGYIGQLDCDQYMAYYNQLTPKQKGEHYRRLKEMLPNMTQEEIKSLANDPFIIVHITGKGAWKVIFD